jgi:hypothetical protein
MNANDFVSVDHVIAEVTQMVNDKEFKNGFSKGWYISRVQDAMRELSFDTFWLQVQHDFEMPENFQIKMPENCFNIREIYLYNGEICNPMKSQVVYWKRLFNNTSNGTGYTAKVKDDGSNSADLFQPNQSLRSHNMVNRVGPKYYYNVHKEHNLIMFSQECGAYPFVRIIFNSMGVPNGDLPTIPSFFERAIVDYVEERFYNAMKSRDARTYRSLWNDAYSKLYDNVNGSWNKAKKRVKAMDTQEKESMEEYISSMYHK